tara:strand:- start:3076 stop:3285 length:210 start_codon:yes stop_codon:yes gene_type:complete
MRKPITVEQVRENVRAVCKLALKGLAVRDPENMSDDELSELSYACEMAQCNIDSYIVDRTNAKPDYMEF